jgi:hypothetical protein
LDRVEGTSARQPFAEKILGQLRHSIYPYGEMETLVQLPHARSQYLRGFDYAIGNLAHWNPEESVEASWAKGHNEVSESALPQRVGNAEGLWSEYSNRRGRDDIASVVVE